RLPRAGSPSPLPAQTAPSGAAPSVAPWGSAGGVEPVDPAEQRERIDLAGGVLGERHQLVDVGVEGALLGHLAIAHPQSPDVALAVVAEEVRAPETRDRRAPVDDAASDRAALVVGGLEHREHAAIRVAAAREGVRRLHLVPAEVRPPSATGRGLKLVDLLPLVLADVADPEVAVGAVEAEAPRVADPVEPHLGPPARPIGERVVGRNAVLLGTPRAGGVAPYRER